MPRPRLFPFALSIGTDICHILRVKKILTNPKRSAQQYFRKVLNPAEVLAYRSWLKVAVELDALKADEERYSEIPGEVIHAKAWPMARFLSGRWAAKEAAIKAHTLRRITMHDITIYKGEREEDGRSKAPTMTIKSKAGVEEQVAKISISHDGEYATAVCLAAEEVEEPDGDLTSEDVDRPAGEVGAPSPTNTTTPMAQQKTSFIDLPGKF